MHDKQSATHCTSTYRNIASTLSVFCATGSLCAPPNVCVVCVAAQCERWAGGNPGVSRLVAGAFGRRREVWLGSGQVCACSGCAGGFGASAELTDGVARLIKESCWLSDEFRVIATWRMFRATSSKSDCHVQNVQSVEFRVIAMCKCSECSSSCTLLFLQQDSSKNACNAMLHVQLDRLPNPGVEPHITQVGIYFATRTHSSDHSHLLVRLSNRTVILPHPLVRQPHHHPPSLSHTRSPPSHRPPGPG